MQGAEGLPVEAEAGMTVAEIEDVMRNTTIEIEEMIEERPLFAVIEGATETGWNENDENGRISPIVHAGLLHPGVDTLEEDHAGGETGMPGDTVEASMTVSDIGAVAAHRQAGEPPLHLPHRKRPWYLHLDPSKAIKQHQPPSMNLHGSRRHLQ
jgi:hypothetical protein